MSKTKRGMSCSGRRGARGAEREMGRSALGDRLYRSDSEFPIPPLIPSRGLCVGGQLVARGKRFLGVESGHGSGDDEVGCDPVETVARHFRQRGRCCGHAPGGPLT